MFLQVVEAGSIVLQSSHDSSEIRRKDKVSKRPHIMLQ